MKEIFQYLKKYNYWDNEKIKAGFKRDYYLYRLSKYFGNHQLVKVLIGQRRAGKSYIMRQLISTLIKSGIERKNIFYLNKELIEFDDIRNYKDLEALIKEYKREMKPRGKIYVFIDEVQTISGWEKIINSLSQNYKEAYDLYITGSNSKMLSGELATLLSGRYVSFDIYPFSFDEYAGYFSQPKNKESFLSYLRLGGLPELYRLSEEDLRANYVNALKNTIFFKDIVSRYSIKEPYFLEALIKFMIDNIGKLFSVNKIVNYLGSSGYKMKHETISNYVGYMKDACLLHEAERYDIRGKAILAGGRKYYINDLAFKNYLSSGFDPGLSRHLENALYLHYRSRGYRVYIGRIGGLEVDFILEKGREKKYVQAAYSISDPKTAQREFNSLEKISDAHEKIVVSLDDVSFGSKNGIKHLLAWEIL